MWVEMVKAHGLGNDFVVVDFRVNPMPAIWQANESAVAKRIADRRTGVGCDQLVTMHQATPPASNAVAIRIFNSDGSEVSACGNATRCVGRLLFQSSGIDLAGEVFVHTPAAVLRCTIPLNSKGVRDPSVIAVDMGMARRSWHEIPLSHAVEDTSNVLLPLYNNSDFSSPFHRAYCLSMGNPHAVFLLHDNFDLDSFPLEMSGPRLETHPLFPQRCNISIASLNTQTHVVHMRVWERGAGITKACGTGACAVAVAARMASMFGDKQELIRVRLPGGELQIDVDQRFHVTMIGGASVVFVGKFDLTALLS